ncbi:MAG: NADH-quinone oxidoreductase subunit NuoE [Bacteroidales bacterium]|nr:NADH-quinone oxidoreductase subunit NuoE [Bacteroidales bacterium]HPE86892.1 NADH-quinone oxidoreductase subunit NuoE [Bacteroidales bacterium]
MKEEINTILKHYPQGKREALIPVLQGIQEQLGFIPEEAIAPVADYIGIPTSKVYGVATFYDQFRFTRCGQIHVRICQGTACHVMGASSVLKALEKELRIAPGEVSKDGRYSLEIAGCIGACSLAPVIEVNGTFYPLVKKDDIKEILQKEKNKLNV